LSLYSEGEKGKKELLISFRPAGEDHDRGLLENIKAGKPCDEPIFPCLTQERLSQQQTRGDSTPLAQRAYHTAIRLANQIRGRRLNSKALYRRKRKGGKVPGLPLRGLRNNVKKRKRGVR